MTGRTACSSCRMHFSMVVIGMVRSAYHRRTSDGSNSARAARWCSFVSEGVWPLVAAK